jgi:microcystin-dependent protein
MSSPFVAEIRIFGCNFAPTGWAQCNGQLLPLSQNTALFSLLGTMYGGDGKSTFALPNLQDSAPMDAGQGQGLRQRFQGETSGTPFVTLLESEMPSHPHSMQGINAFAASNDPGTRALARPFGGGLLYFTGSPSGTQPLHTSALSVAGGSLPHNNMQPYLTLNFCIALQGVFPPRQ